MREEVWRRIVQSDAGFEKAVAQLRRALSAGAIVIEAYRYDPKRSVDQNRRLWAIYRAVGKEWDMRAEAVHEFCRHEFLGSDFVEIGQSMHEISRSTAKLSKSEFAYYMEQVEAWACELGVQMPW